MVGHFLHRLDTELPCKNLEFEQKIPKKEEEHLLYPISTKSVSSSPRAISRIRQRIIEYSSN